MIIDDIGDAIATLFGALTAPSGQNAIQKATNKRQKGFGKLPAVYVMWKATRDLEYINGRRLGVAEFDALFVYPKAADVEAVDTGIQLWHDVLLDTLTTQLQLGEASTTNGVSAAYLRSISRTAVEDEGETHAGLEMVIEVEFSHSVTLTA